MLGRNTFFFGAVLLSSISKTYADVKQCATEVADMHNNNARILSLATVRLAQDYNETCHESGLCTTYIDPETLDYLASAEYSQTPSLPEVPIIMDVDAEFVGFEDDPTWKAYFDTCEMVKGKVCRMDVDIDFSGAALDLVELELDLNSYHMPFCLTDACDGEDLEEVFEHVAKKVIITQVELDTKQIQLVETLTLKQVCAGLGIDECKFEVKNIDCSGDPITTPVLIKNKDATTEMSAADSKMTGYTLAVLALASSLLLSIC